MAPLSAAEKTSALELWRLLHVGDVFWGYNPQSIAEIAADSSLVIVGRVESLSFGPVYAEERKKVADSQPDPVGYRYANLGVRVERVVAGSFRDSSTDLIQVAVWQHGIEPRYLPTIPKVGPPVMLFLKAKDSYVADRGIDTAKLGVGFDADTAAEIVSLLEQGYFLTSVQGVLIRTDQGFVNPIFPRELDSHGAAPSPLPLEADGNAMTLSDLEEAISSSLTSSQD